MIKHEWRTMDSRMREEAQLIYEGITRKALVKLSSRNREAVQIIAEGMAVCERAKRFAVWLILGGQQEEAATIGMIMSMEVPKGLEVDVDDTALMMSRADVLDEHMSNSAAYAEWRDLINKEDARK